MARKFTMTKWAVHWPWDNDVLLCETRAQADLEATRFEHTPARVISVRITEIASKRVMKKASK